MEYFSNEFFLIALTFGSYFLGKLLRRITGWVIMNPILVSIVCIIGFLKFTGISYETYNQGGHMIEFWLRPAVVALGVPLYMQLSTIKKQLAPIVISELAGCVVGIVSVVWIAKELGASREVVLSLASKSVTTPIAMEVTKAVGGTFAYGSRGCWCWVALCCLWLSHNGFCPCQVAGCAGAVYGNGSACFRNGNIDGSQSGAWRLCQSWPYA